jgi:hypothetical protein
MALSQLAPDSGRHEKDCENDNCTVEKFMACREQGVKNELIHGIEN